MAYCDHGYGRPSGRPRVFLRRRSGQAHPATYRSGTPRNQSRGAAGRLPGGTPIYFALAALRSVPHRKRHLRQAGSQFHGLATAIHETTGLEKFPYPKVRIAHCWIMSMGYSTRHRAWRKRNISNLELRIANLKRHRAGAEKRFTTEGHGFTRRRF